MPRRIIIHNHLSARDTDVHKGQRVKVVGSSAHASVYRGYPGWITKVHGPQTGRSVIPEGWVTVLFDTGNAAQFHPSDLQVLPSS